MMIHYLILAGVNLPTCLVLIVSLRTAPPESPTVWTAVVGFYAVLAPVLFLIPTLRPNFSPRHPRRFLIYLVALLLVLLTVAFGFEFQRQFVKLGIPLVIREPLRLTALFWGLYLPALVMLSAIMARLARGPGVFRPALLNPGHGISIPALPTRPVHETVPVNGVSSTVESHPSSSDFYRRNQLTIPPSEDINDQGPGEIVKEGGLMSTPDISKLKEIQDHFAAITNLSLLTYDAQGALLFEPSLENPICQMVQKTEKGQIHCKAHCGRSIGLALQGNDTLFFKCEMNLHVFSIPVVLGEKTKLVLQGGKTFFDTQEFAEGRSTGSRLEVPTPDLDALEPQIRVKETAAIANAARFLEIMIPYLLSTSYEKNILGEKFSRLMTLFTLAPDLKKDTGGLDHNLLNTLGILFNLNTAAIHDRDPRGGRFVTTASFGQKADRIRDYQTDGTNPLMRILLESLRPVSTEETVEILKTGVPSGFSSIHLFPLLVRGSRVARFLSIFNSPLTEEEVQVIWAFCQQISLIEENTALHHETQDLANDLSVLIEIARTVGSALDSEDLFSIILEKSTQFLQAEQGSLMLLDEDRKELTVKAMKGMNKKIVELIRIRPGEGISGKVVSSGAPMMVMDLETDDRILQEKRPRYRTKSFICIPLKLNDRTIGVLNIADKISGKVFSEEDLHMLMSIGTYASVAIERSKFYKKTEELKRVSITDSLTGLLNRRYFQDRMLEEMERSRRHHVPLSLIMIDVDDFKSVNDNLGHLAGDEVLKNTARCIRNSIRTIDVAARYGGEEFTVILPQTSKADAHTIAERICLEVRRLDFPFTLSHQKFLLSVSIGLATYPEDAESLEDLIRNADIALYSAKSQGKNRVVIFGQ